MPMQTRGSTVESDNAGSAKRKPVRRDPEKRRQQNIQAQRKYREKLRKRLENLEVLAESASEAALAHGSAISLPHILTDDVPNAEAARNPVSFPSVVGPEDPIPPLDGFSAPPSFWEHATWPAEFDDSSTSLAILDSAIYAPSPAGLPASNIWGSPIDLISSVSSLRDFTPSAPQSNDSPSTSHGEPSFLIPDNEKGASQCTMSVKCGCPSPHIRIQTQGSHPFRTGEIRVLSLDLPAQVADPYTNHIRIDTLCTVTALYTLGLHIGVTESMLCADASFSPFYRPTAGSVDGLTKANMVGAVQRIFKTLKPDLRPTREQITIEHHPYVDILPFPTLRKNLLTQQEEFDEDEFFDDVVSGLVCWGGAGMGKRDRQDSIGCLPTGTPWDVRSWEARGWFLKKYWALLGGEDGELVRQSEWWCSIRGEDMEVHG
ncbi:bZIP transcription factor [Aspergillus homomorphus CBS 101889]|uniref:BZIP domain-containing protein n=1 Tax=Aspergillus homomorphus (strain CBS 101889) TaxID=1450537 RepID=A0A395I5Y2_ASPHC|nr:hypothetical protein BO97DRAFT_403764 [Aspergillus homomorphus CBS 101889]RAL15159.1 hypothetical protein BO97DRAFT_403764 [Aspergillus homomorphus CBS 101889]